MTEYDNPTAKRAAAARRAHQLKKMRGVKDGFADDLLPVQSERRYEVPVYRSALVRDAGAVASTDMVIIHSPSVAADIFHGYLEEADSEHLVVMLLDTRNKVIGLVTVYLGSLNSAMVRIGEVFKGAIIANAAAIILCHNHPSGDPAPSPEDVALTRQVVEAGKLLDIDVLDHIIVGFGPRRFRSLKEGGLGF